MKTQQDYEKEIDFYTKRNSFIWFKMVTSSINGVDHKKYNKWRKMFVRNCNKINRIFDTMRKKGMIH